MTNATPDAKPTAALLAMLKPMAARVAALDPASRTDDASAAALAEQLEAEFPFASAEVQAIGAEIERGVSEGWLCDRGEPDARFCRLAKATEQTAEMSVDIVALSGPALRHTHPNGEVTMAFPATTDGPVGQFDGHAPGWVVMAAGSTHTPTVTGPRMHLLYFLPGGAVQWHSG